MAHPAKLQLHSKLADQFSEFSRLGTSTTTKSTTMRAIKAHRLAPKSILDRRKVPVKKTVPPPIATPESPFRRRPLPKTISSLEGIFCLDSSLTSSITDTEAHNMAHSPCIPINATETNSRISFDFLTCPATKGYPAPSNPV